MYNMVLMNEYQILSGGNKLKDNDSDFI